MSERMAKKGFEKNAEIEEKLADSKSRATKEQIQYLQEKIAQLELERDQAVSQSLSLSEEMGVAASEAAAAASGELITWKVSLDANPSMPVKAHGAFEASEIYKIFMGIIQTEMPIKAEPWSEKDDEYLKENNLIFAPIYRDDEGRIIRVLPEQTVIAS